MFRTHKRANEYALVILSMGLPYIMLRENGRYYLCVEEAKAEAVREQLAKFRKESVGWPPRAPEEDAEGLNITRSDIYVLACFALLLVTFFGLQQYLPVLQERGIIDSEKIGQWWRMVTSLTLHADVKHLAGNVVSGACFGLLIHHTFRPGLGWLLVLASGFFGNAINVYLKSGGDNPHLSYGASTAIFGALGLLVGNAIEHGLRWRRIGELRRNLGPLFAGLLLLAYLGFGSPGSNTDVTAHIFGFVTGVPLGILGKWLSRKKSIEHFDESILILPLMLIFLAWFFALTSHIQ